MNDGFTIYITGLSGSGKTTLAEKTVEYLKEKGKKVQLIDGDILRNGIGDIFGYTKEDRINVASIIRLICQLLNSNGVNTVVATICGYEEIREQNLKKIEKSYEFFLDCPIEVCIKRDVKGLYRKALNNEEKNVLGIDVCYEKPLAPNLVIDTSVKTIEETMEIIKTFINQNNLI